MMNSRADCTAFPLNRDLLTAYARRWVREIKEARIFSITLYRYSSLLARLKRQDHPVKYCIVFDIDDEKPFEPTRVPMKDSTGATARIERIESGARTIYDILECFQTIKDGDSYQLLMDSGFTDIYSSKPDKEFKQEWLFLTRQMANNNRAIMDTMPHWRLYESETSNRKSTIENAESTLKSHFSEIGQKGGKSRKIHYPILLAITKYLQDNPKKRENSNNVIMNGFSKIYTKKKPMAVDYDDYKWEVCCEEDTVFSSCGEAISGKKPKNAMKSIKFSSAKARYIPEAKSLLSGTKYCIP